MINLLFLGSGTFPTPILQKLIASNEIEVTGLVTSPFVTDNEQEVYYLAKENNLPSFQPQKIFSEQEVILGKTQPDIIAVCNYGQILDKFIINFPKYKTLNIHFSLLPELRGACPIELAVIRGLRKTGISIQIMKEELDTGDIIFQEELTLSPNETGGSLARKLQAMSANSIEEVVTGWVAGNLRPTKQDHSKATYCFRKDISKNAAQIIWSEDAALIERKIRAFNPRPVAWTYLINKKINKRLKIFEAKIVSKDLNLEPGEVNVENKQLLIQTGKGVIMPLEVQLEGKKVMKTEEFLAGYKDRIKFL